MKREDNPPHYYPQVGPESGAGMKNASAVFWNRGIIP